MNRKSFCFIFSIFFVYPGHTTNEQQATVYEYKKLQKETTSLQAVCDLRGEEVRTLRNDLAKVKTKKPQLDSSELFELLKLQFL
jgi:hypothetical protein